jgi:hypothetical protein
LTDHCHWFAVVRKEALQKKLLIEQTMIKYVFLWLPMLVIAVVNGTLRDLGYKKYVGDLTAHQISTFTLILFFAVFFAYAFQKSPPSSSTQAIFIGLVWVLMTLAFEFGFGRLRGGSWQKLLEDYDLFKGKFWVLVPIWVMVAPYIFYKLIR